MRVSIQTAEGKGQLTEQVGVVEEEGFGGRM